MRDAPCIGHCGGTYEFPSKIPVPAPNGPLNFRRKFVADRSRSHG
jgi:hypothetical protein